MPEAHPVTRSRLSLPGVLALVLCLLLLLNWLSPTGFRLNERPFNEPVLFGMLSLLSIWAFVRGRQLSPKWQRLLVRSLGLSIFVLATPAGCASLILQMGERPVAHMSFGSDTVTAYRVSGGAVGPHYTEIREERLVVAGVLLARVIGDSPNRGDVTLSVSGDNIFRAVVSDGPRGAPPDIFECRLTALLPW